MRIGRKTWIYARIAYCCGASVYTIGLPICTPTTHVLELEVVDKRAARSVHQGSWSRNVMYDVDVEIKQY